LSVSAFDPKVGRERRSGEASEDIGEGVVSTIGDGQ
jgi:hypothetical protein